MNPQDINIFITGQKYFGKLVYDMVKEQGYNIVGVSAPSTYSGKYDRLYHTAVRDKVVLVEAGKLNAESLPDNVDLIIAAHSHDFISKKTRLKTRFGAIGFHPSLLPLHRGRDAIYWSIKMNEKVTGGTVYWLTDNVDAGPIAAHDFCFIRSDDTASTLWRRELQPMGIRLFRKVLSDIQNGKIVMIPQEQELSTWEPSVVRPPLFRPDLTMIGSGPDGFQYVTLKNSN